jgi:hypothetical protein
MVSAKAWMKHADVVLSHLAKNLINRALPKIRIQKKPFDKSVVSQIRKNVIQKYAWAEDNIHYIVYSDAILNKAYSQFDDKISILYNDGKIEDIADASDIFNVNELYKTAKKYFLCYPKNCGV